MIFKLIIDQTINFIKRKIVTDISNIINDLFFNKKVKQVEIKIPICLNNEINQLTNNDLNKPSWQIQQTTSAKLKIKISEILVKRYSKRFLKSSKSRGRGA